jgi:SAM-dependent methyltransferase
MGTIRETLQRFGLASEPALFSAGTSDVDRLPVWRDAISGVIFIDDHFVGDETYKNGSHLTDGSRCHDHEAWSYEDQRDSERRLTSYRQFISGRSICDFGCGRGAFLRAARPLATKVCGVELRDDFINDLERDGIRCRTSLTEIDRPLDTVFLFHCFEHLPDPASALRSIYDHLKPGGRVVIEVPHANDFLLSQSDSFKQFTLWSQHLILHTRLSLGAFLGQSGFADIAIEGIQRYTLSNHLQWLKTGKPGGHRSNLSLLDTDELRTAYANSLARIDANDTLVAVAIK